ncbi:MAG TPA: deoxyribose-phosphate aldolase [Erysipelotrichaceae bacterium]|nr:deoxyribose-phosphate aldolase [Erysipelotrichaceae bacterium]
MNKTIDHTLLKPQSTKEEILKLCAEAKQFDFASVCVNPYWVSTCAKALEGTDVKVCTVVGFPLGATSTASKAFETKLAIADGATEIDMVLNIGELVSGQLDAVTADIAAVKEAAGDLVVKVIIEACLLNDEQKVAAAHAVVNAKADFVKTSTGFSTGGATLEDVALLKKIVNGQALVKAAGGVRTYDDLVAMLEAGADRIGTSAGVKLVRGDKVEESY